MRFLFVATFGLLPFWAAAAFIVFAYVTMSTESAGMSLWAFVVAIPACGITLSIAGVTLAIDDRTGGDHGLNRKHSIGFFAASILILAVVGIYLSVRRQNNEEKLRREINRVSEFVAAHPAVLAAVGDQAKSSIASYTIPSSESLPSQYDVSVSGKLRTVYAIVRADRNVTPSKLILACTTSLPLGQREVFKDPCAK